MLARTCCFALQGVEGIPVTVEAFVSGGQPIFNLVGLPDAAVRESRDRVFAALKNNGFTVPTGRGCGLLAHPSSAPSHQCLRCMREALPLPKEIKGSTQKRLTQRG